MAKVLKGSKGYSNIMVILSQKIIFGNYGLLKMEVLNLPLIIDDYGCCNPTLCQCEDETHTPEMGTWESTGIPEISEFDYKGQNTLHWGVFYILEKLSKRRC
jgi:hypothetical protein